MKRSLMQFVCLAAAVTFCLTVAHAEDATPAKAENKRAVPGICPIWPIQQIGNEFLYYSEYHPEGDCSEPTPAYLLGVYPWPVACASAQGLCESTSRLRSGHAKLFRGHAAHVNQTPGTAGALEHAARSVRRRGVGL